MIDIKLIDSDILVDSLKKRGYDMSLLEELKKINAQRKRILKNFEELKARQNELTQKIARMKKDDVDVKPYLEESKKLKSEIDSIEEKLKVTMQEFEKKILYIPNILSDDVPYGRSDKDNLVVYDSGGTKKFIDIDHQTIGEKLGILDFEKASKISGNRFAIFLGKGAKLLRALIDFMLDVHTSNGYKEVATPYMVNSHAITGTGQLPKFIDEVYKSDKDDLYLIPTAEVTLVSMFQSHIFSLDELPLKLVSYTACFRREAGSYGKDVRGLIRNHQFDKVELVWFTEPQDSFNALETLVKDASKVIEEIGIPYRIVKLCSSEVGFASTKSYDIEVWMPSRNSYVEVSSCSNTTDFQTRRLSIKINKNPKVYAHALNASGVACGRLFAAILENFYDGNSVMIPPALTKYTGFDRIP